MLNTHSSQRLADTEQAKGRSLFERLSAFFNLRSLCGILLIAVPLGWVSLFPAAAPPKSDEQVILFPTAGVHTEAGWRVPVAGWIFELEEGDILREAALDEILEAVREVGGDVQAPILERRLRWWLVDNERSKFLDVRCGTISTKSDESDAGGRFRGELSIPFKEVSADTRVATLETVVRAGDQRKFQVEVPLLSETGWSVISDIDDTIKVSNVRDRAELIANTLLREFVAVEGMAPLYQRLSERGVSFHFVSNGPWLLYPELRAFADREKFPIAEWRLRPIRPKMDFADLFDDPLTAKPPVLRELVQRTPQRRFILIGDSGEKDPEVYAAIAREFPEQVRQIWIRNVSDESLESERYRSLRTETERTEWRVFRSGGEIDWKP